MQINLSVATRKLAMISKMFTSVIFLGSVSAAQAIPLVFEKTVYYDAQLGYPARVVSDIMNSSPTQSLRGWVMAQVVPEFDWKTSTNITNGLCEPTHMDVQLTLTYTYPRAIYGIGSNEDTRIVFNRTLSDLKVHERTHALMFRYMARKVEQLWRGVSLQPSCEKVTQIIREKFTVLQDEYEIKNQAFDKREGYDGVGTKLHYKMLLESRK